MQKLRLASLLGACALVAAISDFAAAAPGDPSKLMKDKNAICDAQRRGEGPMSPDMCLQDYPVNSSEMPRNRRQ